MDKVYAVIKNSKILEGDECIDRREIVGIRKTIESAEALGETVDGDCDDSYCEIEEWEVAE